MKVYKVVWQVKNVASEMSIISSNYTTPSVNFDRTFLSEGAAERFRDNLKDAAQTLRIEGYIFITINEVQVDA